MSGVGVDEALRVALVAALGLWAAWWLVSLLIAVVDPRIAARIGPPLLRAFLVGGVVAATAVPSHASGQSSPLDGLRLPERPLTQQAPSLSPSPRTTPVHVVRPGESLWAIVRDHSPGASDAAVATAVRRWHDANRHVIGDDPDLLQPGQHLTPPGAA